MGLLLYALRRKLSRLDFSPLTRTLPAKLGSATAAGISAWGAWRTWEQAFGHDGLPASLGAVFVPMTLAGLVYWGITFYLRVPAARDIASALSQWLRSGSE